MKKTIDIKELSFSYKETNVFDNFSFSILENEDYAVLGENGSGKTTLLKLIAGLLFPNKGTIKINDKDVTNDIVQTRDLAFLFQNTVLYPHLTIYQNLRMGLNYYGLTEEEMDLRIKKMLIDTNLVKKVNFKPRHLSDGEKQLVVIAKALIREPSLLLIDEAFSHLDEENKLLCFNLIKKIKERKPFNILYVSHSYMDATRLTNKILILDKGKIYFNDDVIKCSTSNDELIKKLTTN